MKILDRFRRLVTDPPPAHVFEITADGIAWFADGRTGFRPLDPGILVINPLSDNVIETERFSDAIRSIAPPPAGVKKRRPAALILPDYAARLTVLDFDSLPAKPEEQAALVRFRMKKSLPFDVDSAAMSFHAQPHGTRQEVVVAAVSLEILSRYEAAVRAAGFHPGQVTTACLAALELVPASGRIAFARLNGRVLSTAITEEGRLRLARIVELEGTSPDEIESVLSPTLAFAEDEYGSPPPQLLTSGFEWPDSPVLDTGGLSAGLAGFLRTLPGGRLAA
jgi:type IV pilus assembly protein PilM